MPVPLLSREHLSATVERVMWEYKVTRFYLKQRHHTGREFPSVMLLLKVWHTHKDSLDRLHQPQKTRTKINTSRIVSVLPT